MSPTPRLAATSSALDACALPAASLFVSSSSSSSSALSSSFDTEALLSCDEDGRVASFCLRKCSCRRFLAAESDKVLCVGEASGACTFTDCREFTVSGFASSTDLQDQAVEMSNVDSAQDSAKDSKDSMSVWVWVGIGVGVLLVVALVVFVVRCFKNRPTLGDNRTEIAEAERAVQWRKDQTAARRESVATTRTHGTNTTEVSAVSATSRKTPAQQHYGSPLTGTEIAVSMYPDRVFSPISDESKDSSEYSQGVDEDGSVIRLPLVQVQDTDLSDLDSMSSGLTSEDETSRSASYPRKKSIEF